MNKSNNNNTNNNNNNNNNNKNNNNVVKETYSWSSFRMIQMFNKGKLQHFLTKILIGHIKIIGTWKYLP